MKRVYPQCNRKHGFGLIELMIAVALGLLILVAISQLFIGSRLTYNTADALARVQENGRFAIEILKPELRDLGGQGFCAGQMDVRNHLDESCSDDVAAIFGTNTGLIGWEYDGTGAEDEYQMPASLDPTGETRNNWSSQEADGSTLSLPEALEGRVVPGSDVLLVRSMNRMNVVVDSRQNDTRITVKAGSDPLPRQGIVMIIKCAEGGDIFQQSKNSAQQANIAKPSMSCTNPGPGNKAPGGSDWAVEHDGSSSVFNVDVTAYYIGYNESRDEPGLYRLRMSRGLDDAALQPEELVQGIENMQVRYGLSRPGDQGGDGQFVRPEDWYSADNVADWARVIAVRVSVLARSQGNADVQREQFTFDLSGTDITHPSDRLLRQSFSATIALRNRLMVD